MFAVPCSWQPPPDAANAVGAKAKSATTAASPVHIDFLDTSTSILGTRNAVQAPPLLLPPGGLRKPERRKANKQSVCAPTRASGRGCAGLGGNRRIFVQFLERFLLEEPGEGSMRMESLAFRSVADGS
jgi:hypothetical protein